ncbi:MAG: S4 domain-containing protein [Oscillospiraceae bacterium]
MAVMRLDKILSDMGIASRSELRQIIKSGRVMVDGLAVHRPGKTYRQRQRPHLRMGGSLNTGSFATS